MLGGMIIVTFIGCLGGDMDLQAHWVWRVIGSSRSL